MKKILKVTLVIMLILSTIILIPKTEEADSSSGGTVIYKRGGTNWDNGAGSAITWNEEEFKWIEGSKKKDELEFDGSDMFANGNIFCLSMAQSTENGESYTIQKQFVFDGNQITRKNKKKDSNGNETIVTKTSTNVNCINFAKGLSYILAYNSSYNRVPVFDRAPNANDDGWFSGVGYLPGDDPKQLALWAYLNDYVSDTDVKNFFGDINSVYVLVKKENGTINYEKSTVLDENGNWIKKEDEDGNEKYVACLEIQEDNSGNIKSFKHSNTTGITYKISSEAATIYNNAKAFTGTGDFKIYFLYNKDYQNLLLTETSKTTDSIDVTLIFQKQNYNGTSALNGATITASVVENVEILENSLATSSSNNGNLGTIKLRVQNTSKNYFKIKITETAPSGYIGIGTKTLTVYYDTSGNVTSISGISEASNTGNTIKIKNNPKVTLNFKKQDFGNYDLSGATISLAGVSNVGSLSTNSLSIGTGSVTVTPASNTGTFKIKITETGVPANYVGMSGEDTLTVTYNQSNGTVTGISSNNGNIGIATNKTVIVKNKPKANLVINKTDSLTGSKLAGAQFKIELSNVESIENYQVPTTGTTQNSPTVVYVTTDSSGQIKLTGIVPKNGVGTITAVITETKAPEADGYYYKEAKPVTVKMTYSNGAWTASGASISGNTASVGIENDPYITLSGMVWHDGQSKDKAPEPPNGNKEPDEVGLQEVYVRVHNLKTGARAYEEAHTDEDGAYSFELPKTNEGYRVVFSYDGINWQETKSLGNSGTDSKVENEYYRDAETSTRANFNAKFNTIVKDKAIASDGDEITLGYDYSKNSNDSYGISKLQVKMDGTNPAATTAQELDSKDFQMRARTGVCHNTTENLDCGLVLKELDLAAVMQVDSTTLTINDKTTKYDHEKTVIENLEKLGISNLEAIKDNTVTTNIEYSDYYYRIEDYNTSSTEIKNEDPSDITTNVKELDVYVTYKVDLINQTINSGVTINELAYYYDKNYTLEGIGTEIDATGKVKNNSTIKREALSDALGKNVIKVSEFNAKSDGSAVIKTLYFTFKVKEVNEELPETIATEQGLNCANIVEITSYSTNNALIDRDSAPGNLVNVGAEDDSPQSNGLRIKIKSTERTIEGTVFEDVNKDGVLGENDKKVNGVIVQLIEIRSKASGGLGEYIWQETRSGSNEVVTIARNGYDQEKYTNNVEAGSGQYKFNGFVPGNYIIRYIYGDGRTYDFDTNGNVIKYNGQDYKSTKDPNYQAPLYNTAVYKDGSSVARDNEARRLEVMAYSTTIDAEIGQALNTFSKNMQNLTDGEKAVLNSYYDSLDKTNTEVIFAYNASKGNAYAGNPVPETLSDDEIYNLLKYYVSYKTWMSAETSMINVPVDSEESSINTDSTQVGVTYKENKVAFTNMNFGLTLRPQTKLVLEKHITGLKITPSGTGVQAIIDATKGIEAYYDENADNDVPTGVTTGLATIESDRANRGFWKVETDIEELAQGAQLEVEYTYVIKNEGEKDYLSNILANAYEGYQTNDDGTRSNEKLGKTYSEYLLDLKYDTRGKTYGYGTYLGEYYYTGTPGDKDAEVLSRVETIEEALNNQVKYDEEISGADFAKVNTENVSEKVYNSDGELVDRSIETVIKNRTASKVLAKGEADYTKTLKLATVLASTTNGELGTNIPSYIAEITSYSNAAGRRNMEAEPENLSYVHSEDTRKTMENSNEEDEFWGEQIIISKPTGEDKLTTLQIALIAIASVAVLGTGIILIKKFVLNK